MTSEDEGRGDQPMDWTHGGRDKGRGYSGNKVHQKSLLTSSLAYISTFLTNVYVYPAKKVALDYKKFV